jgi:hypothetical protein
MMHFSPIPAQLMHFISSLIGDFIDIDFRHIRFLFTFFEAFIRILEENFCSDDDLFMQGVGAVFSEFFNIQIPLIWAPEFRDGMTFILESVFQMFSDFVVYPDVCISLYGNISFELQKRIPFCEPHLVPIYLQLTECIITALDKDADAFGSFAGRLPGCLGSPSAELAGRKGLVTALIRDIRDLGRDLGLRNPTRSESTAVALLGIAGVATPMRPPVEQRGSSLIRSVPPKITFSYSLSEI